MKGRILRQLIYEYPERARRYVSLSVFALTILLSFEANAGVITGNDMTVSFNICTGKATVRMRIFRHDCGNCNDDFLKDATYQFRGQNGGWTTFLSDNGYDNDCDPDGNNHITYNGSYGQSHTYDHPIGGNNNCGLDNFQNNYINIYFNVPQSLLSGNSFDIKITGSASDDNGTHSISGEKTVSFDKPSSPINFTASSNLCGNITLTWQNASGFPVSSCSNGPQTIILRNGSYVGALYPSSYFSWSDSSIPIGESANYQIYHQYYYSSNRKLEGAKTAQVQGTRKGPGAPPNNVQANGDCEAAINLSWDWNESNPTNFKVYRDNAYLTTVSGSQRIYEDTSVIGGENYSYQITSTNECGEGSKSDSDGATITASPHVPASLSSQAEPGVGIRVNWPNIAEDTVTTTVTTAVNMPISGTVDINNLIGFSDYLDGQLVHAYDVVPITVNATGEYSIECTHFGTGNWNKRFAIIQNYDESLNVIQFNSFLGWGGGSFNVQLNANQLYHVIVACYYGVGQDFNYNLNISSVFGNGQVVEATTIVNIVVNPNSGYFLERSLIGGAGTTTIEVDGGNTTTYLDEDVNQCISYQYKIKAKNECDQVTPFLDSTTVTRLEPDLSSTFAEEALLGSKGYYPNRVELNWSVDVNETFLTGYKVYRKIAGSDEDSVVVASLESGSNIYIDNFVDAGTLYEYTILGESQCEDSTIYSNISQDIGFRSPFGTVTGQITYGNGTAVKDVKVTAESTTEIAGKSLYFYEGPHLEIKPRPNQNPDNELLVEAWVKPVSFPASATIVQKSGAYDLYYDGGEYKFNIIYNGMMTETVSISDTVGLLNNYFHIAGQLYQDTLKMFINGEEVAAKDVALGASIDASTMPIIIGENFHGNIDELRIWHKGKPNDELKRDHTRLMVGSEAGLNVYLRMNENTGNYAYDISKNDNIFNRNHAKFVGDVEWREDIPTTSQLGIVAYTDEAGNYVMSVPYNGVGESFVITPAFGIHEFDPSTRALYIGDGSFIHNNVDFEDKSSFRVTGTVFYKGTSCPAEGVFLKVDNEIVVENNEAVKTNNLGEFEVAVPIGNHFISVEKQGHVFSEGRFPATGTYNFQEEIDGMEFKDSTLIKIVGRVVGGLREGGKKVNGIETSNNNIGTAQIRLKAQLGNGCVDTTFNTNATTGEYIMELPPLKYIPTVTIPSNQTIDFGTLGLVNLTDITQLTTIRDTIRNNDNEVVNIDSVSYHKRQDYIHRQNPTIGVVDRDGVSDFIGDTIYNYIDGTDTTTVNLHENPFRWPIFTMKDDKFQYKCMIKVFEEYTNLDSTPVRDSVPTTTGKLTFNNELAQSFEQTKEIELNKINTRDSLKSLIYSFQAGDPNFSANASIPDYSYVRKLEINYIADNGDATPWLPVKPADIPTGGDGIFRGYVLTKKSNGTQYYTEGPQVVDYVLRDPPGSGSSASMSEGTVSKKEQAYEWKSGGTIKASDKLYVGANFSIGIGVSTLTEVQNDISFGISTSLSGGRSGSQSLAVTHTEAVSTNGEPEEVGAGSDVYIGSSKNMNIGVTEELCLVPVSECQTLNCLDGATQNNFKFANKGGLSVVGNGYQTHFKYTESYIGNYLMPELVDYRNTLLQSNSLYESHVNVGEANYGTNNDDPVWGNMASDSLNTQTGQSYTTTDTLDRVRRFNGQIRLWKEAIKDNEKEKALMIDDPESFKQGKKQKELDDLKSRNQAVIDWHNITGGAALVGGVAGTAIASLVAPVPGTTIAGYATFAVTSAAGIANAELTDEYAKYLQARERIEDKYNQEPTVISISSGITYEGSVTHDVANTYTKSFSMEMTAGLEAEATAKISNTGVGFKKELEFSTEISRDWTEERESSEEVSYTIYDPDEGDDFTVKIHPSINGWGPIFEKLVGGASSCPHEPADSTEYFLNADGDPYPLGGGSQQREKPTISAAPSIVTSVPVGSAATFNLTLGNESESNDDIIYSVKLAATSNPFGAVVLVDGESPNFDIAIPAGTQVNKVVSVEKGPGAVYEYNDLKFIIHSICQYEAGTADTPDIAEETTISAHFLPACSNLGMASPEPQWVLNNSFNDTMDVSIIDYDINFFGLEKLRVDYKPSSESNWTTLQNFLKDTTGMNDPSLTPIPNSPFTSYQWDVSQISDGNYDLRVVSNCTNDVEQASATHSGIMDRVNPHVFGTPSPSDGILDIGDDILIRFNEPVEFGSLTSQNFDIRGVLNGTETDHSTSLYFDGVDDYLNISSNLQLQDRDFTIEFAARRDGTGEQAIFTQGAQEDESLFIGFNAANKFVCRINGVEVASTQGYTDDEWRYYAVSYNHSNETAELFVVGENSNGMVNSGNTTLNPHHIGSGSSRIGASTFNNSQHFKGNIHDFRIWTEARSLSEFNSTRGRMLTNTEAGLLGDWRMDEAEGTQAKDYIHHRDADISGSIWTVDPSGHAAEFNGTNNHLKVAAGDVVIKDDMDFTLEFWFNSTQAGVATLFSNGSAEEANSDGITSWNIYKDAMDRIHVKHNGVDYIAVSEDYFDGEWHHFALVFNRIGNMITYIDGNQKDIRSSDAYRQLAGSHIYLGAKGFKIGATEMIEERFQGQMDEFRLWNLARKPGQIRRDKRNRMKGDEPGLSLYLPFEDYQLQQGVPVLTQTFDEQINNMLHVVEQNGTTLINTTPTIKLQRPTQAVAFSFSVNNDEIILTINKEPFFTENVTLDITVKDVKDLHGNTMQSPHTWIAFMDQNPVIWQEDMLEYEKMAEAEFETTTTIINRGGQVKTFTIENIPDWLTVSPTYGSISPNSTIEIELSVNPLLNVGRYFGDLHLRTDFGYPELLPIEMRVKAEEPDWAVDPSQYDGSMGIIGVLEINGAFSADTEDRLAAFVDDEARGTGYVQYVPSVDAYLVFLDVYGETGETLSFKIWDAGSGIVYSNIEPLTMNFENNALIGEVANPQVFTTGSQIDFDIELNAGWNWMTYFLDPTDPTDLNTLLGSINAQSGDQIKGITDFSDYSQTGSWQGTLNNSGLQPENLYKISITEPGTLTLKGDLIDPTTRQIDLVNNWNWLGFISVRNQGIDEAFADLAASQGDVVKGQAQFAVYDEQIGWIGSLQTLVSGRGYMYKSDGAKSFTYPLAGLFRNDAPTLPEFQTANWLVNYNASASNMTVMLELDGLCIDEVKNGHFALGTFNTAGEITGIAPIEQQQDRLMVYLTAMGENDESLGVRLLDIDRVQEYALDLELPYTNNAHLGSFNEPLKADIDGICLTLDDAHSESLMAYPSVFSDQITVEYTADFEDERAQIALYNNLGQRVHQEWANISVGNNTFNVALQNIRLVAGAYYLVLKSTNSNESVKLIKE